jgi:two-component system, OmpR family, sensor kinase
VSRVPIRLRLTAAFAAAMVLVLAAAALFTYVRLRAELDESIASDLSARAAAAARSGADAGVPGDPEDGFAQVLAHDGRVIDAAGGARGPVLAAGDLERVLGGGAARFDRRVGGVDETSRILAAPGGARAIVVGQSLEDRDEVLADLLGVFAFGGPIAVLLASLLGYALAGAGLAPVEAMRRRAAELSVTERLPLPAARDELRRLGETLNEMLDRLQRSFERERRFVADASHELRTPVAVIKTELDGLLRSGARDPALVAALGECDHLAQLAEDLLVIARSAEGELPIRPEPIAARELLEGARDRFAERGRHISIEAPDDLRVAADPLRIRQALGNLVDNALRHGEGDITLAARGTGDAIELEVSDHGDGFPPDVADKAFERFTRGDGARTRGGTGLGLAIVRAIAEAHGGSVAIVEKSTVRIRLPSQAHLS